MSLHFPFDNTYAKLPDRLFAYQEPAKVSDPSLLIYNGNLAQELNITGDATDTELAALFSGNAIPEGASPISQAYAGHQFGNFVPSLGDGRAVLLGEVMDKSVNRRDIQLKGSGRTPFSRGGDGRAWLGPVLREYVVSEAMQAMGIPTTRALAAVTTGEDIFRQEGAVPGAVLTRVAASHLRVGTFQYFAARQDREAVKTLFEYAASRHYPTASTPLDFLNSVIARQSKLVAKWMGVGFIHGVMNTDNASISGETIDYGPCAFMDSYHPVTVFSSIDQYGRYAYDRQSDIIVWNMAQLASSLLILEDDQDAAVAAYTSAVHAMPGLLADEWLGVFRSKLGLSDNQAGDRGLIEDLLATMSETSADFTNTFRWLSTSDPALTPADTKAFDDWRKRWAKRIEHEDQPAVKMQASNPAIIPRNHLIERMIQEALKGDLSLAIRMINALSHPYASAQNLHEFTTPPDPHEQVTATFCGT